MQNDDDNAYKYQYDRFDPIDDIPEPQKPSIIEAISVRMKTPLGATLTVLVGAAVFTLILMATYPGSSDDAIPVIKAQKVAFKSFPSDPGGMDIPNQDNTLFDTMRASNEAGEGEGEKAVENMINRIETASGSVDKNNEEKSVQITKTPDQKVAEIQEKTTEEKPLSENKAHELLIQKRQEAARKRNAETVNESRDEQIFSAGSSPDTVEFVRSVLDRQKEIMDKAEDTSVAESEKQAMAEQQEEAQIEPSAGVASAAVGTFSGTPYFVQVASVKDFSGAGKEWKSISSRFTVLDGQEYRVQKADLGSRGIFHRIQAGPFSKSKAEEICAAMKAQQSGSCLVVK